MKQRRCPSNICCAARFDRETRLLVVSNMSALLNMKRPQKATKPRERERGRVNTYCLERERVNACTVQVFLQTQKYPSVESVASANKSPIIFFFFVVVNIYNNNNAGEKLPISSRTHIPLVAILSLVPQFLILPSSSSL